jgi:site-specific DNA-cytosine methylase
MKDCLFIVNAPDGPITYTYDGFREYLMDSGNRNFIAPAFSGATPAKAERKGKPSPAPVTPQTEASAASKPADTRVSTPRKTEDEGPEPAEGVAITIGTRDEVNAAKPQVRFVIMAKDNFYTLWAAFRHPDGHYAHYFVRNLATESEKAKATAIDFVRRIAAGQAKGQAFSSDRMQIDTERYKTFGLDTETWTASELLELSRGPSIPIGERAVTFGKFANKGVLVKDLFAHDEGYALWAADNLSGHLENIGRYLRSRPEYILAKQTANAAIVDALSIENLAVLGKVGLTAAAGDGVIDLGGKTYDFREKIKQAGGRFDGEQWTIAPDKFSALVDGLKDVPGAPRRQKSIVRDLDRDASVAELRRSADQRPDRSGLDRPLTEYVNVDTQALLKRGIDFGIPADVIDEQIEDVAKIRQAYERKSGMFLLASEPGSGKTYVLGAAIRELRRAGAEKIVYVTLRTELISQIKNDLQAFGIEDVEFITYPEMRKAGSKKTDVLIFDEAHSVKNVGQGKAGSQQAQAAEQWIGRSDFTIFSTATPFENPVQAAYLEPTGIFAPLGGLSSFQQAYGAITERIYASGREMKVRIWVRNEKSNADAQAAREYLRKEGVFTSRPTRLPPDMVDARMTKVAVAPEWERRYSELVQAAVRAKLDDKDILARMWMTNFQKRILEAAKLDIAIKEAQEALKRGRNPIIFVETKAATEKDIPDLIAREEAYRAALARTKKGDRPPQRSDSQFELPPEGVVDVLEEYMNATGDDLIAIPSAEEVITNALGKDTVAIFTGSITSTQAEKNLTAWRTGKKKVLVATMAKGGTGLSLHDRTGDHPTTQIVVNLPWTATQVKQVAQRNARYGLKSRAEIIWLFAENIPFDRILAGRVGGRMADMGASVYGSTIEEAQQLEDWSMADLSFDDLAAISTPPIKTVNKPTQQAMPSSPERLLQEGPARPKVASWFSGTGTVEGALEGAQSVMAVEYEPAIAAQFNEAHGTTFAARDVASVSPEEVRDSGAELFHASPVCKNFSLANRNRQATDLDLISAKAVARVIREATPPIVTIENVPQYAETELFKLITDALDEKGYNWRTVIMDAADLGAPQRRKRMIVQAVREGELPPLPRKRTPGDWYETLKDLIPGAPDSEIPAWEKRRLKAMISRGMLDDTKPIITMGGSVGASVASAANAGGPSPTLKASNQVVRIILPNGQVKRVTPRMMARLMGLPDSFLVPENAKLATTVLGNGVQGEMTRQLIKPLLKGNVPSVKSSSGKETQSSSRAAERTDTSGKLADIIDDVQAVINETPRPTSTDEVKAFMSKIVEITKALGVRAQALKVNIREAIEENAPPAIIEAKQKELRAVNERLIVVDLQVRDAVFNYLKADTGTKITWRNRGSSVAPPAVVRLIEDGLKRFQALVGDHPDLAGKTIPVKYDPDNDRAAFEHPTARNPTGYIVVGAHMTGSHVIAHELGHWLESQSPNAAQRIKEFLKRRTAKDKIQQLQVIENPAFGPEEITLADRFYNAYIGRIYTWVGMEPELNTPATDLDWEEAVLGSEVLSIGIEHMITNPTRMAALDMDFFETVFDIIRYRGEEKQ